MKHLNSFRWRKKTKKERKKKEKRPALIQSILTSFSETQNLTPQQVRVAGKKIYFNRKKPSSTRQGHMGAPSIYSWPGKGGEGVMTVVFIFLVGVCAPFLSLYANRLVGCRLAAVSSFLQICWSSKRGLFKPPRWQMRVSSCSSSTSNWLSPLLWMFFSLVYGLWAVEVKFLFPPFSPVSWYVRLESLVFPCQVRF